MNPQSDSPRWKASLHRVIFEADTPLGKAFDVALIAAILLSVLLVMLDSVRSVTLEHGTLLRAAEWTLTILFTVEYVARLVCAPSRRRYATSFFGLVDLIAILPTYLAVLLPAAHYLLVVRVLRILRVFRVFKLVQYISEAAQLRRALVASRRKITVFLFAVFALVVVIGSVMYLIEGEEHGFTSIPRGVYWAIVTLTTVGYGDVAPQTPIGQALASLVMVLGYGIIAVPTGIVTAELTRTERELPNPCPACGALGHLSDAIHCRRCGVPLGRD
ncbi:MAG: ion transporter [Planctomycetota bacterium]|nr:ion transporter [Planctomycetota bacterium]